MAEVDPLEEALRAHLRALTVEIGPRTVHDGSLGDAARYIRAAFEDAGLEVHEQTYGYRGGQVANLIAAPPGTGAESAYYVVGAHYDTVRGSPGADDNASAVAVMLELARRLPAGAPPLRLVAFTLEEAPAYMTGNQGSRAYIRSLKERGEQVLGAAVLEMVGYTARAQHYPTVLKWAGYPKEGNYIGIVGNRRSRRFTRALLAGFRDNPDLPVESLIVPFDGWVLPATRLSDHASFWDHGFPAVMITDTAFFRNPYYHTPDDTMETLDFRFMARLVRSLELALGRLER